MYSNKEFEQVLPTYKKISRLHWAAKKNRVDVMRTLLAEGIGVNSRDKCEETALHSAAGSGNKEAVEFLLKKDADVNARNKDNETPLYFASKYYYVEVAKILLGKGADASIVSKLGYTPLHWWSLRGHMGMVRAVLAAGAGASINIINTYKETTLHWASQHGHKGIVMILLAAGASDSSSLKNNLNKTPIDLANSTEIKQILQNSGTELQKVQNEKIGNSGISLLDIVLASEANLVRYAYDTEVCKWFQDRLGYYVSLKRNLQKGQFGAYNDLIYTQYQAMKKVKDASKIIARPSTQYNIQPNTQLDTTQIAGGSGLGKYSS